MRIGIDGIPLAIPFPCGSKHYAEQLLNNLAQLDKKNEYIIFSQKNVLIPIQKNFHLWKIPTYIPILKRQFFISYFVRKTKIDIFHNLEPFGSNFLDKTKVITTIHDLDLNYTYPLIKYPVNRIYCEYLMRQTLNNTDFFITDTKFISEKLINKITKKNVAKITKTIPLSHDSSFIWTNQVREKKILAMGDLAPRKNIVRVIEAFSYISKKYGYSLTIITSTIKAKRHFEALVKLLAPNKKINVYVNVSTSELVCLYNMATCFIFPSLYEGFGLPILEAMACGCPVITSNRGAMKEIAGDSALLVNPESTNEIYQSMERLICNPQLLETFSKKGLKRASTFSWTKTADETYKVYKSIYK